MKREPCDNMTLSQTPFKMVTAFYMIYLKTTSCQAYEWFLFLSFLLFMIVTTKTAKAIISVRLSKTVTRLSFPGNA